MPGACSEQVRSMPRASQESFGAGKFGIALGYSFGMDLGWIWDRFGMEADQSVGLGPRQPCPSPMKTKAHARQKHARKHELARSKPEECQKHARTMPAACRKHTASKPEASQEHARSMRRAYCEQTRSLEEDADDNFGIEIYIQLWVFYSLQLPNMLISLKAVFCRCPYGILGFY